MTYTLGFVPETEQDLLSGYTWYEAKSPGLGGEFLRMFYAQAGEIIRNPRLYPIVHGRFRRCLLRRFPYSVYFTVENNRIIVFGIFRCARDPRMIRGQLGDRRKP
ncbi:MAG TPA: type II toxin-antitoxin system RelE/ParE family toxin [bacterium]|nr:type II toxin-antitoxin system RelE/ParE family toxin [bacterium]